MEDAPRQLLLAQFLESLLRELHDSRADVDPLQGKGRCKVGALLIAVVT